MKTKNHLNKSHLNLKVKTQKKFKSKPLTKKVWTNHKRTILRIVKSILLRAILNQAMLDLRNLRNLSSKPKSSVTEKTKKLKRYPHLTK